MTYRISLATENGDRHQKDLDREPFWFNVQMFLHEVHGPQFVLRTIDRMADKPTAGYTHGVMLFKGSQYQMNGTVRVDVVGS